MKDDTTAMKDAGALGIGRTFHWNATPATIDMSMREPEPRRIHISTEPQTVICDLNRTAIVIIDMQNDFCTKGGWVDHIGGDYEPDRAPIEPLQALLPELREAGVPVIWVNWGVRPDAANLPPNQIHLYKPTGRGTGITEDLPNGHKVLTKDSWAAATVDELAPHPEDYQVDKHRISGFWDTPLDSILRNLGIKTVMFSGVNTDQCVMMTLTDANFLGYGCIMVTDCCATTSPEFCTEASIWNVKKCFGFVCDSHAVLKALKEPV